jgi:hypothetical protein
MNEYLHLGTPHIPCGSHLCARACLGSETSPPNHGRPGFKLARNPNGLFENKAHPYDCVSTPSKAENDEGYHASGLFQRRELGPLGCLVMALQRTQTCSLKPRSTNSKTIAQTFHVLCGPGGPMRVSSGMQRRAQLQNAFIACNIPQDTRKRARNARAFEQRAPLAVWRRNHLQPAPQVVCSSARVAPEAGLGGYARAVSGLREGTPTQDREAQNGQSASVHTQGLTQRKAE